MLADPCAYWRMLPLVLQEFIASHLDSIIARASAKLTTRTAPRPTEAELIFGVPLFCDQLIETLRLSRSLGAATSARAMSHGNEMRRNGFTVGQVVQDLDNIRDAITDLAIELDATITVQELRTLHRCLDEAIAEAVTEYERLCEQSILAERAERLGFFAHELRNRLAIAMLSLEILRGEDVAIGGSTGALLERSLADLRALVECSLDEVRVESAIKRFERVAMVDLLEEVEVAVSIEAKTRGLRLTVKPVPPDVAVEADRQLLTLAVANLLQNAFKVTPISGNVTLKTHATANRVLIEVEDEGGGTPPPETDDLSRPSAQWSSNRAGIGLSIGRTAVRANRGDIRGRYLPGKGCVFTIDLPRAALSQT